MRYRSARITPGANPPTGIESEDLSRPTRGVGLGATWPCGPAVVRSCEGELIASPHEEQNRLSAATSTEHDGHVMSGDAIWLAAD